MVLFGFLGASDIRFARPVGLPKQLSQFGGIIQPILIDRMTPFFDTPIAPPITKRILRHAEKIGGLLDGHEFTQFRHRTFLTGNGAQLRTNMATKPYQSQQNLNSGHGSTANWFDAEIWGEFGGSIRFW